MLTRREFTRLAMAGAASQVVSPLLAQGGDRKIGYGIIGLGRISMDHFMPGVLASKNSKITGLVSGHRDKALAQAAKYGVRETSIYSYENMDEFKNNPAIDAVYVALPNSMHAEYTIRSAKAGKHVLCEKPMSTTVSEADAMIAAHIIAHVGRGSPVLCAVSQPHKQEHYNQENGDSCDPRHHGDQVISLIGGGFRMSIPPLK